MSRCGRNGAACAPGAAVRRSLVFSLSLVVLLLIAGLAIDAGNAFLQQRDGQNVSDLASMAGTQPVANYYLNDGGTSAAAATNGPKVYTAIQTSVTTNGCQATGSRPARGPLNTSTTRWRRWAQSLRPGLYQPMRRAWS